MSDSCRRAGVAPDVATLWLPMTDVAQQRGVGVGLVDDRLTSARGTTPRFFAVRVAAPVQTTSRPRTIIWATE